MTLNVKFCLVDNFFYVKSYILTYFPTADSSVKILSWGLADRFVRPMDKLSGPKDLFKMA